jgi:hypothetical protein
MSRRGGRDGLVAVADEAAVDARYVGGAAREESPRGGKEVLLFLVAAGWCCDGRHEACD